MNNPNVRGKKAEDLVKKNLWQRNYRVKDVSKMGMGFDLLINDKHKVEVKSMSLPSTTVPLNPEKFDVLCIVVLGKLQNTIHYLKDKKFLSDLERSAGVYAVNEKLLKEFFTRKPKAIFS